MKPILFVLAGIAIATGILWMGQGLGIIQWPQSSFMLDQRPWAVRGALLVFIGVVLLLVARRR
ncbi:hypothetical protein H9L13_11075 [Sphingomonas lutea]|uniref:Uncharacterized protein n=1 Tax=Sphingomonas lutea TaxID=1045317 RepID=A0A7G9SH31_9SPHN|nr:hypothetical protein [Sphingomonas lutea]QNN67156.1 hypothetical protein H9L13_11075 [Sphingomonas lutea]